MNEYQMRKAKDLLEELACTVSATTDLKDEDEKVNMILVIDNATRVCNLGGSLRDLLLQLVEARAAEIKQELIGLGVTLS